MLMQCRYVLTLGYNGWGLSFLDVCHFGYCVHTYNDMDNNPRKRSYKTRARSSMTELSCVDSVRYLACLHFYYYFQFSHLISSLCVRLRTCLNLVIRCMEIRCLASFEGGNSKMPLNFSLFPYAQTFLLSP